MALLGGNVGLFARVELTALFTPGGAIQVVESVQSVPVDPYYGSLGLWTILFDVVFVGYWLYLVSGTLRRLGKALYPAGVSATSGFSSRNRLTLGRVLRVLANYWRLLDITTTLSLIVTLGLWFTVVSKLDSIRDFIDNARPTGPPDFAGGPSPLSQQLFDAHATWMSWKASAVVMVRDAGRCTRCAEVIASLSVFRLN